MLIKAEDIEEKNVSIKTIKHLVKIYLYCVKQ